MRSARDGSGFCKIAMVSLFSAGKCEWKPVVMPRPPSLTAGRSSPSEADARLKTLPCSGFGCSAGSFF